MIEIIQTGQAGKTEMLFDMHRLRKRVFKDRLQWDVTVNAQGLEIDQFDTPEAVYLLHLNAARRVTGSWRLLSCAGPTMLRDIWPEYLKDLHMPARGDCIEVSRFAVDCPADNLQQVITETQQAIGEMFCALTEFCMRIGVRYVYTLYDARIEKVINKIDCTPQSVSETLPIDGMACQAGIFKTDTDMLQRLRAATGIQSPLISKIQNPPYLVFGQQAGEQETYDEASKKPA